MILGYIITDQKLEIENFKVLNFLPDDNDTPKLIIGREFIKKLNIKSSILNKKIDNNTFWTYSSKEKKSEYLDDLEIFKNYCIDSFVKKITYYYIDPFSLNYSQVKKIINKFKTNSTGVFHYNNNMCFIFFDNILFGLHWESLEFMNITKDKILNFLKGNNFSALPKDEIFNICVAESQKLNNAKILPYLYYSKKYDKQNLISNFR